MILNLMGAFMRCKRKLILAASLVVLAILSATHVDSKAQENETRLAHANGSGTLKVGNEEFKISAVIVKLLADRKAELTLVSEITIFLNATWSTHGESQHEFDLEITRGGLEGGGKIILTDDGKSVARLNLKGISQSTKRPMEASFEGKQK